MSFSPDEAREAATANDERIAKRAIRSTAADRAVDFARAADAFERAAANLRVALSLTAHHGARISYGEAVAESIDEWAREARKQYETSLRRARGQHREQLDKVQSDEHHKYMYADGTTGTSFAADDQG